MASNVSQESNISNSDKNVVDLTGEEEDKTPHVGKRTDTYKHFEWIAATTKWKCKYCGRKYSKSKDGSTGTLINHLKRNHAEKYHASKSNVSGIKQFCTTVEKVIHPVSELITKEEHQRKLIKLIVRSDLPFSFVENEEFRRYTEYISKHDPATAMPGRLTIRKQIGDTYNETKQIIMELLQNLDSRISFTLDCWTSSNQFSFMGVIASFIDNDWKLRTLVLDLTILEGSHAGINLAMAFSKVLEEYNLWGKFLNLTTDNAYNMDTMFKKLESIAVEKGSPFASKDNRIRCMAHVINLVCKACLESVDGQQQANNELQEEEFADLDETGDEDESYSSAWNVSPVTKIRKSVVAIRNHPQRAETFLLQCHAAHVKPKKLIRDMPVRWNSTLDMLERALELKVPLQLTLQVCKKIKYILKEHEWTMVNELIKLLKPFRDATVLLSSEKIPTMSLTTAIYEGLFTHLEKYLPEQTTRTSYRSKSHDEVVHPDWLATAAKCGWEKLTKYYPSSDGLAYVIGTALDPCYKLQWHGGVGWDKKWIEANKKLMKMLWEKKYKTAEITAENSGDPPEKQARVSDLHLSIRHQLSGLKKTNKNDELSKYLSEPVLDIEYICGTKSELQDILQWWKIHAHEYPNLSRMAKDFLATSGTGVPVERFFSSAPDLLSSRRQSLSPKTIRECLCLKSWLKNDTVFLDSCQVVEDIKCKVLGDGVEVEYEDASASDDIKQ